MDEINDTEQLAELESLLYSQIHHSTEVEPSNESSNTSELIPSQFPKPRYFQQHSMNQRQNIPNHVKTSTQPTLDPGNVQAPPAGNDRAYYESCSNFSSPLPQTIHLTSNQPIQFCQPPVNNIVFMQHNSQQLIDYQKKLRKERNRLRRLKKREVQRLNDLRILAANNDAELFKKLNLEDRKRVLVIQKRQRYDARKKNRKKLLKEQKLIEKHNSETANGDAPVQDEVEVKVSTSSAPKVVPPVVPSVTPINEVIVLSETDEDEIVAIEPKHDLVVLSSDDEEAADVKSSSVQPETKHIKDAPVQVSVVLDDDDAVDFVENQSADVIRLDSEATKTDAQLMKPPSDPSDIETTSISSATSGHSNENLKNVILTPKSQSRIAFNERRELINTPESSNDFLDSSLEILQAEKGFLKPRSLAEVYESESSCSASDISTPLKHPGFNDLFLSPSKELFGETNLESFSDFITPKRKSTIPSILTPNALTQDEDVAEAFIQVPTKATSSGGNDKSNSDSNSSSESEYEESKVTNIKEKTKRKRLPSLSHFEVADTQVSAPIPVKFDKKKKANKTAKNKFDFVKEAIDEQTQLEEQPEVEQQIAEPDAKLSKKARKRKQRISENVENQAKDAIDQQADVQTNNTETPQKTSKKRKKPSKSKSDTELEVESELVVETSAVAKKSKKKQKSKSDSELEEAEVVTLKSKKPPVEPADAQDTSLPTSTPTKNRKKRKSKSDTEELIESPSKKVSKKRKAATSIDDCNEGEDEGALVIDFDRTDGTDVELIENPTPECIDLSSYFSSDDEETHFSAEELNKVKTKLELSNVSNDGHNSWEVQSENDHRSNSPAVECVQQVAVEVNPNEKSWCRKNFDTDQILKSLSTDPRAWKILERDRVHIRVHERGPRCNKCRQLGHLASHCDKSAVRCWMCGDTGHQEPRCPNTVCTRCGRYTRFFTTCCGECKDLVHYKCRTCGSKGHTEQLCPDLWRRYHLTTKPGPILQDPANLKALKDRWCSGCAKQGHFEHTCKYYNRIHLPSRPNILKYNDVYGMSSSSPSQQPSTSRASEYNNRAPYNEDDEDPLSYEPAHHKHIEVKVDIDQDVHDLLNTPKGIDVLKELSDDLCFSYDIQTDGAKQCIVFKGHPIDVFKVKKLFYELIKDPNIAYRKINVTKGNLRKLRSDIGQTFIKSLNVTYNLEHECKVRVIYVHGTPLDVLVAQHKIEKFFLDNSIKSNVATTRTDNQSQDTNSKEVVLVDIPAFGTRVELKVSKRIYNELVRFPEHTILTNVAKKHKVKWSITTNGKLVLEGTRRRIGIMRSSLGNITSDLCMSTYDLYKDTQTIFDIVENPPKDSLETLLDNRKYLMLNVVIFVVHRWSDGEEMFKALVQHNKRLSTILQMKQQHYEDISSVVNYFKEARPDSEYEFMICSLRNKPVTSKRSINTEMAQGDLPRKNVHSFDVPMFPQHIAHLLGTPEGKDLLNELNTIASFRVVKAESKLVFNCTDQQKDIAMRKVIFYFQILEFDFPMLPSQIYHDLSTRLTKVVLDYYLIDCKQLYDQIYNTSGDKAALFSKLHSLLFVKYKFLDGSVCVDIIKEYLQELRTMDDEPINVTDYRKLKTAAMYLFCPFPLDINYKLLLALTTPPVVTAIDYTNDFVIEHLHVKLREARHMCQNDASMIFMDALCLFEAHLTQTQYSKRSVEICYTFLKDNFSLF